MKGGNKGEWSEPYVFLKLLADGKLHSADPQLNAIPNLFYPIVKILSVDKNQSLEYCLDGSTTVSIVDSVTKKQIKKILVSDFDKHAALLLDIILTSKKAMKSGGIESFLKSINKSKGKALLKDDKSDIKIVIRDHRTLQEPELGFSIKSMLGGPATLFNSNTTTNFIFEVTGSKKLLNVNQINDISTKSAVQDRIKAIEKAGCKLSFTQIESKTFALNLQIIDSDMPIILANLLLLKYSGKHGTQFPNLLAEIIKTNPLDYDLSENHPFYQYKIKSLLTDIALGMTAKSVWLGEYSATGGIIIVKRDGDLVCLHIYNRSNFQNYLITNTKLDGPSTKRMKYGALYEENGNLFFKLNLHIRFN